MSRTRRTLCGSSSGMGAYRICMILVSLTPHLTARLFCRYKADQATWAANEHLGECSRIIEEFEQAAEIEGRDLSARNKTILLNEAAAAGWAI